MTIIKLTSDGKVLKKKDDDTVVPLTVPEAETEARTLHISYVPSSQSKKLVNVFLLVIALLVLAAGVIGGVYLYKYLHHKHGKSHVSIPYNDDEGKASAQEGLPWCGTVTEDIDIQMEEEVEKFEVPRFDDCKNSIILHDFHMNYTAIVDLDDQECFIKELDREEMTPPKSLQELLRRYSSGYYMPKFDVVRRDYKVVTPALEDLHFAGASIEMQCMDFDSYLLEKREPVFMIEFHFQYVKTFGYTNLRHVIKDRIFK